jgi:hypothetical protein
MSETKNPSSGRIVHFFHNEHEGSEDAKSDSAEFVPAIVTQAWGGLRVNMTVFPVGKAPFAAWSVAHESEKTEKAPYWIYPEIK